MSVIKLISTIFTFQKFWKVIFFVFVKNSSIKILGIDYGDFTIGLAIHDAKTNFTYPFKTIYRDKPNILRKSIREIVSIIDSEKIDEVVVGLPLNVDGTEGERVDKVKNFCKMLNNKIDNENIAITINFQDERFSTLEAREILREHGIKKSEEKKYIDQVAAEIILGDYIKTNK